VDKRVAECRHVIKVPCSTVPERRMCLERVKPLRQSECRHDTLVPCGISAIGMFTTLLFFDIQLIGLKNIVNDF